MLTFSDRLCQAFPRIDIRKRGESTLFFTPTISIEVAPDIIGYSVKVVALQTASGYDFDTDLIASFRHATEEEVIAALAEHLPEGGNPD